MRNVTLTVSLLEDMLRNQSLRALIEKEIEGQQVILSTSSLERIQWASNVARIVEQTLRALERASGSKVDVIHSFHLVATLGHLKVAEGNLDFDMALAYATAITGYSAYFTDGESGRELPEVWTHMRSINDPKPRLVAVSYFS